jgi:hypothetical protein
MSRNLFIIALVVVAAVIAGIIFTRARVLAVPEQPLPFSHETHTRAGLECLFCHSSALRSPVAGIPSVQKCLGCHDVIATDRPAIQQLAGYWERGEPIPWVRVNTQPEFVGYSHEPHLGAGINCETCHGDVSRMDVARPVVRMDMGWCLACHLEQPEEKVGRLADCLTCHK